MGIDRNFSLGPGPKGHVGVTAEVSQEIQGKKVAAVGKIIAIRTSGAEVFQIALIDDAGKLFTLKRHKDDSNFINVR